MALFGKKKKAVEISSYCCGGDCPPNDEIIATNESAGKVVWSVKILGTRCSKCNQLEKATREALTKLGMDVDVDHVSDFSEIASYGVMSTPALVINKKVVSVGKVLKSSDIIEILQKQGGK